jgi:hypothetical protein
MSDIISALRQCILVTTIFAKFSFSPSSMRAGIMTIWSLQKMPGRWLTEDVMFSVVYLRFGGRLFSHSSRRPSSTTPSWGTYSSPQSPYNMWAYMARSLGIFNQTSVLLRRMSQTFFPFIKTAFQYHSLLAIIMERNRTLAHPSQEDIAFQSLDPYLVQGTYSSPQSPYNMWAYMARSLGNNHGKKSNLGSSVAGGR